MDLDQRPELQCGTIEFEVPEIYWTRHPASLRVLFAIDVSFSAVNSGVLESFCQVLSNTLFSEEAFPKGTQVGIITFDTAVHFYNLSVSIYMDGFSLSSRICMYAHMYHEPGEEMFFCGIFFFVS